MLEILKLVMGPVMTNCYIVKKNKQVLIIDPVTNLSRIAKHILDDEKVLAVLLTHGHYDHIGAADACVDQYHCPLYIHPEDEDMLLDPRKNYSNPPFAIQSEISLYEDHLSIGEFEIEIYHTPGHSRGSVSLLIDEHLFTGDCLFKESIGRVDLYGGSMVQMRKSLSFLKTLNPSLPIYPGHEDISTLAHEFEHNPYL